MIKAIVIRLLILAATIFICCEVNSQVKETIKQDTTINSKQVTLYTGSKGGKYILVTSKSGNVYKKYLKTNKAN